MRRMISWYCECGARLDDVIADEDEIRLCDQCHVAMHQDWLPRVRRDAQWDDNTSVMILVNHDPSCPPDARIRYPGSHQARVPAGYERVYLRSLREVDKFEKAHGVANEQMHFNRNGRSLDDTIFGVKANH